MSVSLPVFLVGLVAAAAVFGLAGAIAARRARASGPEAGEATRRLAVTEQRLAHLTELTSEWMWEVDANLRFTYLSHEERGNTGAKARDLIGRRIHDLVDPDEPSVQRHLEDLADRRPFRNFQYRTINRQGKVCHVRVSGTPLFDASGAFLGYRGISSDVTAEVQAEMQAAEAQGRLTDAIENISAGFLLCDAQDRLVACNSRYRQWFFPGSEETLRPGMTFGDILRHAHSVHPGLNERNWGPQWEELRLARRRALGEPFELHMLDNRILLAVERGTADGGVVSTYTDITEVKAHEKEIASKSAALEATFDNMSEGITMVDRDLKVVGFNRRFVEMFSFPAESLTIGMPYEDLLRVHARSGTFGPGDAEDQVRVRIERAKRGGSQVYVIELPDGRMVQMRRKSMPAGGFINTYTDITDVKRRERELADKSALFEAVLDNMGEGVAMIDRDLNLLAFNQRFVDLLDLPRDRVRPGVGLGDIYRVMAERGDFGPGDREEQIDVRLARARRFQAYTAERMRADGVAIEIRSNPIPGGGAVVTFADITKRVRAERALRASEERYALAQRGSNEGLWDWDIEQGEVYVSPRIMAILDLSEADFEAFKRGWFDYVHADDVGRYRAAIIAHLKGQTDHYTCEYRVRSTAGTYRWVRDRGLALRREDGRAYRMAGSVGDITAEAEAVQALRQAKDVAEAANRTKSEFLANMSHELRTPLNAIIGFAEMMKLEVFGQLGNDHYRDYIADIHHSGQHLLNLINDILDVSKVEAGKIELHETNVEVAEVVAACVRLINERATSGKVAVAIDLTSNLPTLYADEHRVKQVLLNLLSNAVKFTPPGGTVTVRARADRMQGFAIEVIDTGIGIAAKDVPRALEPFVQIDSALNRRAEGTGLGLPLSRALMALHGGSLDIVSEPGKGTNVRVTFPVVRIVRRRRTG